MAKNFVFHDSENLRRTVYVGKGVAPGTPLIYGGQPAVAITGSGDYTSSQTFTYGSTTVTKTTKGGFSLRDGEATLAFDGSVAANVEGVSGEADAFTINATTLAKDPKPVYITSTGTLTLTKGDNKFFGIVDFYRGELSASDTVVKFGVFTPEGA